MDNKNLQKEILIFINIKNKESKNIVNDISIEFKSRGYEQEIIDKNLYSLAKNGEISSGREIDDMNHRVYSPLFILEKGRDCLSPWYLKHLITTIIVISSVISAIFSALTYFE